MTFTEMLDEYLLSALCWHDSAVNVAATGDRFAWSAVAILAHEAALRARIAELEKEVLGWLMDS